MRSVKAWRLEVLAATRETKQQRRQHLHIPDEGRIWRRLTCPRCQRETEHIYCQRSSASMPLYVCWECGEEEVGAVGAAAGKREAVRRRARGQQQTYTAVLDELAERERWPIGLARMVLAIGQQCDQAGAPTFALTGGELARRARISSARAYTYLSFLERRGLIETVRHDCIPKERRLLVDIGEQA